MRHAKTRSLASLPGVLVAFLPKLACPACWPAYAGLLSSLGLGFLMSSMYLFPLTVGFLAIALIALSLRTRGRYAPLMVGSVGAGAVLLVKFVWDLNSIAYVGVGLLAVASIWHALPHRRTRTAEALSKEFEKHMLMELAGGGEKKRIEVFTAGCTLCEDTIEMVLKTVGPPHEILIHDMNKPEIAFQAR